MPCFIYNVKNPLVAIFWSPYMPTLPTITCLSKATSRLTQFLSPDGPSVHTKTAFLVTENGTFWKRSPKWKNLKTPASCIVWTWVWTAKTGENGPFGNRWRAAAVVSLSQSLLNSVSVWTAKQFENDNVDGEHFFQIYPCGCSLTPTRRSSGYSANGT